MMAWLRAGRLRGAAHPPGWLWLLLPTLALWPVWRWSAQRMSDGSDDPFGIVALAALLLMIWRERRRLSAEARLPWLLLALLLCAATALAPGLPPLLRGVLAVLTLFAVVLALRASGQALLAWLGLGLLALPIMSSLQFFIGYSLPVVTARGGVGLLALRMRASLQFCTAYPRRVRTAEVSAWLLRSGGLEVLRQGST